ncbi:PREDICTED: uncharacterized protein LOC104820536 isoform X2 [Tarenaya hassleriana]|uniref:uncharacterized protein LOC104820536 isoform X2 n=1 Tax=Tarenaya hassleriana TaxID=28532 RepID=UPI0008FCE677|nr:PREDICTED: uncharacterized protein LOC104820536 isoform X2 [Tarenaya hassleriana]
MAARLLSTTLFRPPTHLPKSTAEQSPAFLARRRRLKYRAQSDGSQGSSVDGTVYQGVYGPWTIEPSDVREVILYRSGLVTAAASFVAASSSAFLPENSSLSEVIKQNHDFLCLAGASGLGLSLFLIHIYVTEIKRTLQAFWALGFIGSFATYTMLARPAGYSLVQYVVDNPTAVWFVGPLFAALTGLVFKEGLCYGKLEAGILTFIIPAVLLGHLFLGFFPEKRRVKNVFTGAY